MARDFIVYGETLVLVLGSTSQPDNIISLGPGEAAPADLPELGLADGEIRISPRFAHRDLHVDDFGPEIPAEVMSLLADALITMTLVHYDPEVLEACIQEATGGSPHGAPPGVLAGAGALLGNNDEVGSENCHFINLMLDCTGESPWRFPAAYLLGPPLEIPIGTRRSAVRLTWRAIPYVNEKIVPGAELISANQFLWIRELPVTK